LAKRQFGAVLEKASTASRLSVSNTIDAH
jgi:hypothetical protein